MALKVELKAGERLIIGECMITNGDQRARFLIEGKGPILREKDIMSPKDADSPCKKIYLAVQLMYLSNDIGKFKNTYFELINDLVQAAPSTIKFVSAISNHILTNDLYKALKEARALIEYEQRLLAHVQASGSGILPDQSDDGRTA
jgi:flagellar biosynthesis repressor protein FlbT